MLGQDVVDVARQAGHAITVSDRAELDITDAAACREAVAGFDVVVNCAAWTAVDDAETNEGAAFDVNAVGPANLARAASEHHARLVQVSTDYVFAGDASSPYAEDAPVRPASAYGRTKAAGEWGVLAAGAEHVIVRTAWLYGAGGASFPRTIVRAGRARGALSVVSDQVGQPTWTADLADLILRMVDAEVPGGIYHGTSSGVASWYDFARAAVESAGMDPAIVSATTSAEFTRPAPRPAYSVLGHDRLVAAGVQPIGPWHERWSAASSDPVVRREILGLADV